MKLDMGIHLLVTSLTYTRLLVLNWTRILHMIQHFAVNQYR